MHGHASPRQQRRDASMIPLRPFQSVVWLAGVRLILRNCCNGAVWLGPSRNFVSRFTEIVFSTLKQNWRLSDREEIFAKFDPPKKVYWMRFSNCTLLIPSFIFSWGSTRGCRKYRCCLQGLWFRNHTHQTSSLSIVLRITPVTPSEPPRLNSSIRVSLFPEHPL